MDQSLVTISRKHGVTCYSGPDATLLAHAIVLKSGLSMWHTHHIIPTRGVTITKMLSMTTRLTTKPYKPSQVQLALDDLTQWIEAMKLAMPIQHTD